MAKNFNQFTNKTTSFVATDRLVGFSSTAENGEFKTTYSNLLNSIESSLNLDGSSFTTNNGYQKIGALIIQWGFRNGELDDKSALINFPITFPNDCLNVQVTLHATQATNLGSGVNYGFNSVASAMIEIVSTSSFRLYGCGEKLDPLGYYWLAIGH